MISNTYAPKTLAFKGLYEDLKKQKKAIEKNDAKFQEESTNLNAFNAPHVQAVLNSTIALQLNGSTLTGKDLLDVIGDFIKQYPQDKDRNPSPSPVQLASDCFTTSSEWECLKQALFDLKRVALINYDSRLQCMNFYDRSVENNSSWDNTITITPLGEFALKQIKK